MTYFVDDTNCSSKFAGFAMNVGGNVYAVYNLGSFDTSVNDLYTKVNDGQHHVVRFYRNGSNSTIQVDQEEPRFKKLSGRQLSKFNGQSAIFIGSLRTAGKLTKSFQGILSGLVWNGHHLLSMASSRDPRSKIEGQVEVNRKSMVNNYMKLVWESAQVKRKDAMRCGRLSEWRANCKEGLNVPLVIQSYEDIIKITYLLLFLSISSFLRVHVRADVFMKRYVGGRDSLVVEAAWRSVLGSQARIRIGQEVPIPN
ncbi:hypothetical protein HELRODRAFT_176719 [Helobdella robusta]|uniref:Laminin G domain-containing protein n=1 Tax=Helobdella robusta TaxID=6412 RepID=T1FAT8_HELRO|nr:hypothetical protein HELRODRAFT_176719 [Helobdella robusta]ESN99551.1 hypothetical protein HELRODRAFT_176719 [Helobdella robusta]